MGCWRHTGHMQASSDVASLGLNIPVLQDLHSVDPMVS